MELVILFILLGIVSSVRKKNRGVSGNQTKPQRRSEPVYHQVHSPGAEQLVEAMKNAVQNAANRGEAWAQTLAEPDASAKPIAAAPAEGDHVPLAPSGEGTYVQTSEMHDRDKPDSCRSVVTDVPAQEPIRVQRAVRRQGAVSDQRAVRIPLVVNARSVQQGLLWSEILTNRGGRGRIH